MLQSGSSLHLVGHDELVNGHVDDAHQLLQAEVVSTPVVDGSVSDALNVRRVAEGNDVDLHDLSSIILWSKKTRAKCSGVSLSLKSTLMARGRGRQCNPSGGICWSLLGSQVTRTRRTDCRTSR